MTPSPELSMVRHLAARTHASAAEAATASYMSPAAVRIRLVACRQDKLAVPPRRVRFVAAEGQRLAEVSDMRATTA